MRRLGCSLFFSFLMLAGCSDGAGGEGTDASRSTKPLVGDRSLVSDIYLGATGSNPELFAEVDGKVYFVATHPTYGKELWSSDGTSVGTALVADLNPGG